MRKIPHLFIAVAAVCIAAPSLAQTAPTYTEASTGNTKQGQGNIVLANPITLVDASSTITTGGTGQVAIAASTTRQYLFCQNPITETETLYINIGAGASTAGKKSYELAPGSTLTFTGNIPIANVNIVAVTTGHAYICKYAL